MNSELDDVKATIRALLISDPRNRCTLNDLYHQYKETEGEELPFRKFNCRSTYDFIKMMPDTVKILNPHDPNTLIIPVVTKESAHVFKLVSEQNASKKRNLPRFRPKFNPHRFDRNIYQPRYHSDIRPDIRSRPPLSDDFKQDVYELLKKFRDVREYVHNDVFYTDTACNQRLRNLRTKIIRTLYDSIFRSLFAKLSPTSGRKLMMGIFYEDFNNNIKRLLRNRSLYGYDTQEVLKFISEFAFYNRGKIYLLSSSGQVNGKQGQNSNDEVIDISSDESAVIEISDDEEFKSSDRTTSVSVCGLKSNGAREQSSKNFDVDLSLKLRSLFNEPENADGIWLTKLTDAYRLKFSHSLSPKEYGYSTITDMVKDLPHVFHVEQYRTDGDSLLLDARKYSQPIEHNNNVEEKGEIPPSLIEKLKKVVQHEVVIYTADLPSVYEKMYHTSLRPEEYGFKNMDSFLQRVQDLLENMAFCRVVDRTLMKFNAEKVDALPGEVTYDPIPSEVCNADFKLDNDSFIEALKEGNTFEVNFGEIYSPGKFYITHINRLQLLSSMMADLNSYYVDYETKYKVLAPLVTRNLLCACLYSVNNEWHRVRVISVSATLKTAKVFFIDYGTMESIDVNKLRYLHKNFAKYPPLCVCAKLSAVQPKNSDTYEVSVNREFFELCGDYDLEVKIVRVYATCLEVLLYLLDGERKISVREELISRGLVMPKSDGPSSPVRATTESYTPTAKSPEVKKSLEEDYVPEVRNKNSIAFFNKLVADNSLKEKMKSAIEGSNTMRTQPNNELDENAGRATELEHSPEEAEMKTFYKSIPTEPPPGFLSAPSNVSFPGPATSTYGQFQNAAYPYQVSGTSLASFIPYQSAPYQRATMLHPGSYGSYFQNHPSIMSPYPYSAPLGNNPFHPPPGINVNVQPFIRPLQPMPNIPPSTASVGRGYCPPGSTWYSQNSNASTSADIVTNSLSNLDLSSASQRSVESARLNSARHTPILNGGHSMLKPERSKRQETAALRTQEEISQYEELKLLRIQQDVDSYLMLAEDYVSEFTPKINPETGSAGIDSKVSNSEISTSCVMDNGDGLFVDGLASVSVNEEIIDDGFPNNKSNEFCDVEKPPSATPIQKTTGKNFGSIRDFVLRNTQNITNQ